MKGAIINYRSDDCLKQSCIVSPQQLRMKIPIAMKVFKNSPDGAPKRAKPSYY
jgi:hypothetical protein